MTKYHIIANIAGAQKPRVIIDKNIKNEIIFQLIDWNLLEKNKGWTSNEIKELVYILETGLEKLKFININENTKFLFDPT